MQELTPDKPVKISGQGASAEISGLNNLLRSVNTPEFSQDDGNGPFVPPTDPIPEATQQRVLTAARPLETIYAPPAEKKQLPQFIFTTGRLRVGKDFILKSLGYQIHGFADPLYALQKYFFGTDDKTVLGARKFLQTVGQWGRGQVDANYPLTATRATFTTIIRGLGQNGSLPKSLGVDWSRFGLDPDLWLNAFLTRMNTQPEGLGRHAVSNVRFNNEHEGLSNAGWTHFHVMCSPQTWAKRLKEGGGNLTPQSPEVKDFSEQLAAGLDADSLKRAKLKPQGPKLRVIWNDPGVRSPSPRFYTLNELE